MCLIYGKNSDWLKVIAIYRVWMVCSLFLYQFYVVSIILRWPVNYAEKRAIWDECCFRNTWIRKWRHILLHDFCNGIPIYGCFRLIKNELYSFIRLINYLEQWLKLKSLNRTHNTEIIIKFINNLSADLTILLNQFNKSFMYKIFSAKRFNAPSSRK